MSGPVASEGRPAEAETSTNKATRSVNEDEREASENGKGDGKEKEKSEDKDSKAWQQEGDFAYEYVQLAQVRYASRFTLHLPISLLPGLGVDFYIIPLGRNPSRDEC